jgi:hypothetical protein
VKRVLDQIVDAWFIVVGWVLCVVAVHRRHSFMMVGAVNRRWLARRRVTAC